MAIATKIFSLLGNNWLRQKTNTGDPVIFPSCPSPPEPQAIIVAQDSPCLTAAEAAVIGLLPIAVFGLIVPQ